MGVLRGSSFSPTACTRRKDGIARVGRAHRAVGGRRHGGSRGPGGIHQFLHGDVQRHVVFAGQPGHVHHRVIRQRRSSPSANSASVAPVISSRIDLPSGDGIIFCVCRCRRRPSAPPLVWLMLTELLPVTAGLGAVPSGAAAGVSVGLILSATLADHHGVHRLILRLAMNRQFEALRQQGLQHLRHLLLGGALREVGDDVESLPGQPQDCSQEGPETWYGLTSYALQINCISEKFPISTRLASIFIPTCSFPAATMAGVTGSEGLMDATSNAGVCASSDPAANTIATPRDGNNFWTRLFTSLVRILSDIGVCDCNRRHMGRDWGNWGIPPSSTAEFHANSRKTPQCVP